MTAQERLLALVNQNITGKPLRLSDVYFGIPTAIPETNGRNTEIGIIGRTESGYFNTHRLQYRRLDLGTLSTVPFEVTLHAGSAVNTDALVDALNRNYHLDLDYTDVVKEDNLGAGVYRLKAITNGCRVIGEVDVHVQRIVKSIEPSLQVTTLGEFTY